MTLLELIEAQGLTANPDPVAVRDALNAKTITAYRDLAGNEVRIWAAGKSLGSTPAGTSELDALHTKVQSNTASLTETMAYHELNNVGLATSSVEVRAMIAAVLPETGAELIALAQTLISPAEEVGLGTVSVRQIVKARN